MDAVLYARVSSDRQEREGFSIPAQLDLLRNFAKLNDIIVIREFVEAESAKASGREVFGDMLKFLARPNAPKLILVEKTDRLYRNFKDYVLVNDLIEQLRLEVRFVKEGEVMGPNASSHSKFIHSIKVVLAKNYIDNLREETAKGRRQKILSGGWPSRAPFGYLMNNRKELEPNPDKAPMIQEAFALYATGNYSLASVSTLLYAKGFVYQVSQPKVPVGRLEYFLKNPLYMGKISYQGDWLNGNHQPLVSPDVFEKAQQAFKRKARPCVHGSVPLTYRGRMTCGECGRFLVGEIKKGKYTYYRCSSMKSQCSQGYVKEELVNEAINAAFLRIQMSPSSKEMVVDAARQAHNLLVTSVDTEREVIDRKITLTRGKLRRVYDDHLDGVIDVALYKDTQKTLQETLLNLEATRSRLATAEVDFYTLAQKITELPSKAAALWSLANSEERSRLLSIFTSNFTVMDGEVTIQLLEGLEELPKFVSSENMPITVWAQNFAGMLLKFKPIVDSLAAA